MKKMLWRDMFLVFAVLAFACLLLGGGSRLIATPDQAIDPVCPPSGIVNASLTCPARQQTQTLRDEGTRENRVAVAAIIRREDGEKAFSPVLTDANGNVLRQQSYMRAVYQVFALGDGFA